MGGGFGGGCVDGSAVVLVGGTIGIFCWGIGGIVCIGGIGVIVDGITGVWSVRGTGGGVIWALCCRVVWYGCVGMGVVYDVLVVLEMVGLMVVRWVVGLGVGLAASQWVWGVLAGSGGCVWLLS